ncbi:hypothetical protein HYC85_021295, partial [Camellia sinensis]
QPIVVLSVAFQIDASHGFSWPHGQLTWPHGFPTMQLAATFHGSARICRKYSTAISLSPNGEQSKPFEFLKYFHGTHKGDKKSIKTYKLNYHLSSTGTLDAATLTKMMMPRCSVPDINNGKTSMRSWKKNHVHGSGSSFIHTVAFENWASVTRFTFEEIQTKTWLSSKKKKFKNDVADVKISFQIGDLGDGDGAYDGPHGVLAHSFAPDDGRFILMGRTYSQ